MLVSDANSSSLSNPETSHLQAGQRLGPTQPVASFVPRESVRSSVGQTWFAACARVLFQVVADCGSQPVWRPKLVGHDANNWSGWLETWQAVPKRSNPEMVARTDGLKALTKVWSSRRHDRLPGMNCNLAPLAVGTEKATS